MKGDESFIKSENLGQRHLEQLNHLFTDIVSNLEQGRGNIFDLAEDCRNNSRRLQTELLEVRRQTKQIIEKVDNYERLERESRLRLVKVSRDFNTYSEQDIKDAYNNARELKIALIGYRNQEYYLRKHRDDLESQIRQFEEIAAKAENFLNTTGAALKLLEGNVERISGDLEGILRRQLIEMWIVESQEAERRKIARELHDGPAQSLASMLIRLDLIDYLWEEGQERIAAELDNIKGMGQESISDIRRLMFDLKPTVFSDEGFAHTLREYFSDYEAKYNFTINFIVLGTDAKYDSALEMALYRIVQEAITNVRKYAGVNEAIVKMEEKSGLLTLIIRDEGCGFNIEEAMGKPENYGILGMKERVELFGGEIDINSSPGQGTQVIVKVPLKEEVSNDGKDKGHNRR